MNNSIKSIKINHLFGEYSNAMHHAFFDSYLHDSLGGDRKESLSFFKTIIEGFKDEYYSNFDLISKLEKIIKIIESAINMDDELGKNSKLDEDNDDDDKFKIDIPIFHEKRLEMQFPSEIKVIANNNENKKGIKEEIGKFINEKNNSKELIMYKFEENNLTILRNLEHDDDSDLFWSKFIGEFITKFVDEEKVSELSHNHNYIDECYENIGNKGTDLNDLIQKMINDDSGKIINSNSNYSRQALTISRNNLKSDNYPLAEQKFYDKIGEIYNNINPKILKLAKRFADKVDELNIGILPASWMSEKDGGHLISFYCEKKTEDKYDVIFFNSGAGISRHLNLTDDKKFEKLNEKNLRSTSYGPDTDNHINTQSDYFFDKSKKKLKSASYGSTNVKRTDLIDLVYNIFLFSEVYIIDNLEIAPYLYHNLVVSRLNKLKKNSIIVEEHFKEKNKILGQLSGTCSYFGIYYVIKYLFYKIIGKNHCDEMFKKVNYEKDTYIFNKILTAIVKNENQINEYFSTYYYLSKKIYFYRKDVLKEYGDNVKDNEKKKLNDLILSFEEKYHGELKKITECEITTTSVDFMNENMEIALRESGNFNVDFKYSNFMDTLNMIVNIVRNMEKNYSRNRNFLLYTYIILLLYNLLTKFKSDQLRLSENDRDEVIYQLFEIRLLYENDYSRVYNKNFLNSRLFVTLILSKINEENDNCYFNVGEFTETNIDKEEICDIYNDNNIIENLNHEYLLMINKFYIYLKENKLTINFQDIQKIINNKYINIDKVNTKDEISNYGKALLIMLTNICSKSSSLKYDLEQILDGIVEYDKNTKEYKFKSINHPNSDDSKSYIGCQRLSTCQNKYSFEGNNTNNLSKIINLLKLKKYSDVDKLIKPYLTAFKIYNNSFFKMDSKSGENIYFTNMDAFKREVFYDPNYYDFYKNKINQLIELIDANMFLMLNYDTVLYIFYLSLYFGMKMGKNEKLSNLSKHVLEDNTFLDENDHIKICFNLIYLIYDEKYSDVELDKKIYLLKDEFKGLSCYDERYADVNKKLRMVNVFNELYLRKLNENDKINDYMERNLNNKIIKDVGNIINYYNKSLSYDKQNEKELTLKDEKTSKKYIFLINDLFIEIGDRNNVNNYLANDCILKKKSEDFCEYEIFLKNKKDDKKYNLVDNDAGKNYRMFYVKNGENYDLVYLVYGISLGNQHLISKMKKDCEHNEILMLMTNNSKSNNCEIIFPYHLKEKIGTSLSFSIINNKLLLNNEEIITSANENNAVNKWILNIPLCFLKKNDSDYDIIFLDILNDEIYSRYFKNCPWSKINSLKFNKYMTENKSKYAMMHKLGEKYKNYYVGKISENGLDISFNTKKGEKLYIILCMLLGKDECLHYVLVRYLYKMNKKMYKCEHSNSKKKDDNAEEYDDIIVNFVNNGWINSPYVYYYQNILLTNYENKKSDKYLQRFYRGHYYDKYNVYEVKSKVQKLPIEIKLNYDKTFLEIRNILKNDIFPINEDKTKNSIKFGLSTENSKLKTVNDDTVIDCLNEFKNSYTQFNFKKEIFENNYEGWIKNIDQIKEEALKNMYNLNNHNKYEVSFLIENKDEYYKLMQFKLLKSVLGKIHNKILNKESDNINVQECKREFDMIDENLLFNGSRNVEIVLIELLSGYFIRKEQHSVYERITKEIDKNLNGSGSHEQPYSISQLLMGRGKSSVIVPLILFKYYISNTKLNNIIIGVPDHLIVQTHEDICSKFNRLFGASEVKIIKSERYPELNNPTKNNLKRIYVATDTSLKSMILNTKVYEDNDKDNITKIQSENSNKYCCNSNLSKYEVSFQSLIIYDEIDSIYNPMRSDLNFPVMDKIENISFGEEIENFLLNFTEYVLMKNKKNIRNYKKKEINNYLKEYVMEHGETSNKLEKILSYYTNHQNDDENMEIFKNKFKDDNVIESFKTYLIFLNIYKTLTKCFNLPYSVKYGMPNEQSHGKNGLYMAVPYSALDSPLKKSSFSGKDILFILTMLTFYYHDIRIIDLKLIVKDIQNSFTNVYKFIGKDFVMDECEDDIEIIGKNLGELINVDLELDDNLVINMTKNVNEKLKKSDLKFKKNYLKKILKKLKFSSVFFNSSAMDIIDGNFSKYKCGFSGTVNMLLPYLHESTINNYKDKRKISSINENELDKYKNNFYEIKNDPKDDGSIFNALIHDDEEMNANDETKKKHYVSSHDGKNMIEITIYLINEMGYDVMIDSGALFIGLGSPSEIILKIAEGAVNKKKFIYIENGKKKFVHKVKNNNGEYFYDVKKYNNEIFPKEDVFVFYDNKNTVGIDIKQTYDLLGILTISKSNKLTDVSQAAFRLRHLNYGQKIDFFIDDKSNESMKNFSKRIDVVKSLLTKEKNELITSVEEKKLEQNVFYLDKMRNGEKYKINKFDIYEKINNLDLTINVSEEIKKDYYREYINDKLTEEINKDKKDEKDEKDDLIIKIIKKWLQLYDSQTVSKNSDDEEKEQEQELKQEQEQEEEQEEEEEEEEEQEQDQAHSKNFEIDKNMFRATDYVYLEGNITIKNYLNPIMNLHYKAKYELSPINIETYNELNKLLNDSDIYYGPNFHIRKQVDINAMDFGHYYIKIYDSNVKYVIITEEEFDMIIGKINENNKDIDKALQIKNYEGHVIKSFGEQKKDVITKTELMVQLLLGNKLNLFAMADCHGEMKKFEIAIKNFEIGYGLRIFEYLNEIKDINLKNDLKNFISVYSKISEKNNYYEFFVDALKKILNLAEQNGGKKYKLTKMK